MNKAIITLFFVLGLLVDLLWSSERKWRVRLVLFRYVTNHIKCSRFHADLLVVYSGHNIEYSYILASSGRYRYAASLASEETEADEEPFVDAIFNGTTLIQDKITVKAIRDSLLLLREFKYKWPSDAILNKGGTEYYYGCFRYPYTQVFALSQRCVDHIDNIFSLIDTSKEKGAL